MKKITNFIIKGRYFFLTLFIILAGICLFLSSKVNINEDIMEYLPKTSETKIGKDIMDKEFTEQDSSSLNVMFKGLSNKEKEKTLHKLENIKGVYSVSYENTKEYNKDDHTLYILNVNDYAHSQTASDVYNYVKDNFKIEAMSGSIYDEYKPILQIWIVILAIACAMVILIFLSDSYVEPWLYLISIGIAVFINKGTNIMFDSVSSITNSIVAILQLALSMDYSIMLSNRYKQEKQKQSNKIEAMKEALYHSFQSISSSSITTIVGLIALVFMSFTIGKDLGFVLAKGVLLSLISIFLCLPALLLIFDNLLEKTKKKAPKFKLNKLGAFIYKTRYIQTILIVILFISASFIKGNINILYTGSEQDKVGKVFPTNNQIAVVYNNKYESLITNYCKELEKDKKINQVLCYSNTINEKLAFNELKQKFKDLGQDVEVDNDLIRIVYYNYYNQSEDNKMTLNEFISFIKSDIYPNNKFNKKINKEMKENIELLTNFTSDTLIKQKRSPKEIAKILGMNEKDAENILIYYNSKNLDTKMTIKEFVDFLLNDVAKDQNYAKSLDLKTISKIEKLQSFTNLNILNKEMNTNEIAELFGIDKNLVEQLFLFYRLSIESDTKLTLNKFANFALELSNLPEYKDMFNKEKITSLILLKNLSDNNVLNTKNIAEMTTFINNLNIPLDSNDLTMLYILYTGNYSNTTLNISEVINIVSNMTRIDAFKPYINDNTIKSLQELLGNLTKPFDYNYQKDELINISPKDKDLINILYGFKEYQNNNLKEISFRELINFVYENKDNSLLKSSIEKINVSLDLAYLIINNIETAYNYKDISNITNIDVSIIKQIFSMYDYNNNLTTLNPVEFIDLILNNKDNELLSSKISLSEIKELELVKNVSVSTLNKIEYTSGEISNLLSVDKETIKLLFSLYNSKYAKIKQEISLNDYISFLVNDVMNNKDYKDNFDNEKKTKLTTINNIITGSLNNKKYTSIENYDILSILSDNLDKSLIEVVYIYYGSNKEYNRSWKMTIEEFVNYLNSNIIKDKRFADFIDKDMNNTIKDAKRIVDKSKKLIVSDKYSRTILNTKYAFEDKDTYEFVNKLKSDIGNNKDLYIVGNSPMAVEMDKTFNSELNKITLLTMIFIFIVVAITFKDLIIPLVLVLIIQTAVYLTMSVISLAGGSVYFISLLIVQAILMGATIDYAIVYTSYYRESRLTMGIKDAIINAYNKSIHTIISSSSILIIVTLVVAGFASAIAAKICETISQGTFASVILILFILPGVLATTDKLICRKGYYKNKKK